MKNLKYLKNEKLFIYYFLGFTLLRYAIVNFKEDSIYILGSYTAIILGLSTLSKNRNKSNNIIFIKIFIVVLITFLLNTALKYNAYISMYAYDFFIYGMIPMFLLVGSRNSVVILENYYKLSLLLFFLYLLDPLNKYKYFVDYMGYGFNLALPIAIGIDIGVKFLNKKKMLFLEVVAIFFLFIFSNRSSSISFLFYIFLSRLLFDNKNLKKLFFLNIGSIVLIYNFKVFFNSIYFYLRNKGVYSYSLARINQVLTKESNTLDAFSSGRLELWKEGIKYFFENIIFGGGIGYFKVKTGGYSHNIIIDILVEYGLFGLLAITLVIVYCICQIYRSKRWDKLLGVLFFCLWFPKLLFSIYFYKEISFWCFILWGFVCSKKNRSKLNYENID